MKSIRSSFGLYHLEQSHDRTNTNILGSGSRFDRCQPRRLETFGVSPSGFCRFRRGWRVVSERASYPIATAKDLEHLLLRAINRTDVGNEPLPQLGFIQGMYSVNDRSLTTLTIQSGGITADSRGTLLIELPETLALSTGERIALLIELISLWEPLRAIWTSRAITRLARKLGMEAGWLTWFRTDASATPGRGDRVLGGILQMTAPTIDQVDEAALRELSNPC